MDTKELLSHISVDPNVAGGKACIRGTRIYVATILDGMAEGLTPDELRDHYPQLSADDIKAALAYGGELAREGAWKIAG